MLPKMQEYINFTHSLDQFNHADTEHKAEVTRQMHLRLVQRLYEAAVLTEFDLDKMMEVE